MARLFIQENEQDMIDILCLALEMENFETQAVLGYDADFIGLIGSFRPHLVMLDYKLDGAECISLGRLIRKHFPLLPQMAMSCTTSLQETYQKHGFDGCLAKPFDLDNLYYLLKKLINTPAYE